MWFEEVSIILKYNRSIIRPEQPGSISTDFFTLVPGHPPASYWANHINFESV
jgi:hypothetical protein